MRSTTPGPDGDMSGRAQAAPSRRAQRRAEPRRGDERERALLAAAEAAVRAGTFEGMSITQLTASAEVSRPTFYFYFASKDALLATLVEKVLTDILSGLTLTVSRDGMDTEARIHEGVELVAAAWLSHREVLCAAVELSGRMPALADLWSNAVIGSVEIFLDGLDLTRDRATLRRQSHLLAWGQERNLYNLAKAGGDAKAFAELTTDLTEMWLTALHGPTHLEPEHQGDNDDSA